jgi:hypothetical protein
MRFDIVLPLMDSSPEQQTYELAAALLSLPILQDFKHKEFLKTPVQSLTLVDLGRIPPPEGENRGED